MTKDISIKIAEDSEVSGTNPIVILGPNGAGKTRHAVAMSTWNTASFIGALRNIELPPDIAMQSRTQAKNELDQIIKRRQSRWWQLSNEINQLFAKLLAEDTVSARAFRDSYTPGYEVAPETTNLMRLETVWSAIFPGRSISFADNKPVVQSAYSESDQPYTAQQMSDGERVALYLAGRVLDSEQPIIIIDEPEVHFHSRLATRFWNEMEALRPDCRFVYVTHDLPFALSRAGANYVVIMPNNPPQVLEVDANLPKELAESLLAAASFSIYARRIVFCEGIEGPSLDQKLYVSWFNSEDTAVVPVESCENVVQCTTSFGNSSLVIGVDSIGIIDRDYWPEDYFESLPNAISVLPYHEVESLFCLKEVYCAVSKHLGNEESTANQRYAELIGSAKESFVGALMHKQISERFRRRCEHQLRLGLNGLTVSEDFSELVETHAQAVNSQAWDTPPDAVLDQEKTRLEQALAGPVDDFLKYFPGKVFYKRMASSLGLEPSAFVELICSALVAPSDSELGHLGSALTNAFQGVLPPRSVQHGNGD